MLESRYLPYLAGRRSLLIASIRSDVSPHWQHLTGPRYIFYIALFPGDRYHVSGFDVRIDDGTSSSLAQRSVVFLLYHVHGIIRTHRRDPTILVTSVSHSWLSLVSAHFFDAHG
jgi:hypothetical protein